jgi:outer membrane lipase/esterase
VRPGVGRMKRIFAAFVAYIAASSQVLADPADYSRVVVFGDSLSDSGNLTWNTGSVNGAGYLPGRATNGYTWVELLTNPGNPGGAFNLFWGGHLSGFLTGPYNITGNVNAAVAGAQATGDYSLPGAPFAFPAVDHQILAFHNAGGVFGANDLVIVQGGANNFLQQGAAANPVAIATGELSNIGALALYGARTILVANLPDLGATPSAHGDPSATLGTVIYNTVLNGGVQQLARQFGATNFVQMDWFAALNVIRANPEAFGFTNTTNACVLTAGCVAANGRGFLFWDTVHPTEAAHELLARYAALLLSTEETGKAVGALGQTALSNRLDASDILFRRGVSPLGHAPGGLYAEIIGQTASFDGERLRTYGGTGYDYSIGGARAGFDASQGAFAFGAAAAYQTGQLSGKALNSKLTTYQFDAYALSRLSVLFAGVEAGASFDEYRDVQRGTGFPTVTGKGQTRGRDYTVDGVVGLEYMMGGITITPAARVGYASVSVDGYAETAPILALGYGDREITTGFYTARLRAAAPVFGRASAYAEIGYEGLFSTSDGYTAKLVNNTAHAVLINDAVDGRGLFVKAGVGGYVTRGMKVDGEYELSTQNGAGDIHSGRLRLTIPLSAEEPTFKD